MEDFCFIITAYKQLRLTEQNVLNIRNNYNHLNSCPIIIVSTSEEDIGFDSISEKHDNIYVIKFFDAPGSLKNSLKDLKELCKFFNLLKKFSTTKGELVNFFLAEIRSFPACQKTETFGGRFPKLLLYFP